MVADRRRPDQVGLEAFALGQGGYFDRGDAHRHGVGDRMLHHHTRSGRFARVFPGVYRLAIAPLSPRDEYLLAWVWTNYRGAVSHESALALYDLSDVVPSRVHLTVPRGFHRTTAPFQVHTAPLPEEDVQLHAGVAVTTPARSIVDAAATGTDPNQVHRAVREAFERALTTPEKLRAAAARRGFNRHRGDVRSLMEAALQQSPGAAEGAGRSPSAGAPQHGQRGGPPPGCHSLTASGTADRAAWSTVSNMTTRTLPLQVPEELVALLGTPEAVAARAKEALVLDLLRRGQIGQSKAAELLGVTRGALLDLMAEHRVPSGAETAEELAADLAAARRYLRP